MGVCNVVWRMPYKCPDDGRQLLIYSICDCNPDGYYGPKGGVLFMYVWQPIEFWLACGSLIVFCKWCPLVLPLL